ncbi:hypothetical protein C8Q76DRAFT_713327, partial [Earliella scabrosa]
WRAVEAVLKYLCGSATKYLCWGASEKGIFDVVEHVRSAEELIDFVFEVMAVAWICSWVIMKRVWINNACSVLTDATHYHATALVRLVQKYIAINMEVFLESRMLEDLAPDLAKQLSAFVRAKQARKYPVSRSTRIPIVPSFRPGAFRDSPRLSPPGPGKRANRQSNASAPGTRGVVA